MSPHRIIPTDAAALAAARIVHMARRAEPVRIAVRLEPEPDGTPAAGFYIEARRRTAWVVATDAIAGNADEAAANVARIHDLAHQLDRGLSAWLAYHGAASDADADWIQETAIARANELTLTAYRISQLTEGAVSEDHVQAYLTRRKSMGSHKLQHILRALGLAITPA